MSATQRQMESLINFMDEHPQMAKNYFPETTQRRHIKNKLWTDLAGKLNSIGLPNKSVSAWKKVWIEFKYRAKRKCSQNLLSIKKTGGGPYDQIPISELEKKAIQIASLRRPEDDDCEMDEDEEEITESPKKVVKELTELGNRRIQPHATTSNPKRRAKENDPKLNLLKTKVEADNNFQSGVLELLKQHNNEEANFQVQIIKLLEKRNEIAAKQLELTKQMHNNNN